MSGQQVEKCLWHVYMCTLFPSPFYTQTHTHAPSWTRSSNIYWAVIQHNGVCSGWFTIQLSAVVPRRCCPARTALHRSRARRLLWWTACRYFSHFTRWKFEAASLVLPCTPIEKLLRPAWNRVNEPPNTFTVADHNINAFIYCLKREQERERERGIFKVPLLKRLAVHVYTDQWSVSPVHSRQTGRRLLTHRNSYTLLWDGGQKLLLFLPSSCHSEVFCPSLPQTLCLCTRPIYCPAHWDLVTQSKQHLCKMAEFRK